MPVISILNAKGGTGKTTLTLVLACELARNGATVSVIDASHAAVIAGWKRKRAEHGYKTLFDITAASMEADLIPLVERCAASHEFVLIDLAVINLGALTPLNLVLIPFNQSPIDASVTAKTVIQVLDEAEVVGRNITIRLVRSRDNPAVQTKTAQRIIAEINDAELPILPVSLVERAAYRDIFDFAQTLEELDPAMCSGVPEARKNAHKITRSVLETIHEELLSRASSV